MNDDFLVTDRNLSNAKMNAANDKQPTYPNNIPSFVWINYEVVNKVYHNFSYNDFTICCLLAIMALSPLLISLKQPVRVGQLEELIMQMVLVAIVLNDAN